MPLSSSRFERSQPFQHRLLRGTRSHLVAQSPHTAPQHSLPNQPSQPLVNIGSSRSNIGQTIKAPCPCQQVSPELEGVLGTLRRHDPRLLADTRALVEGLERLTVTHAERWAMLLAELEVR